MKKLFFAFLTASIFTGCLFAQQEKKFSSELKSVLLFPYEAQENRTASIQLEAGKQEIKLTGLSPYIKGESVRVEGDGSFSILNVTYEMDYLSPAQQNERTKGLQEKIKQLRIQIQDEETDLNILNEKVSYFESNQNLSNKENKISTAEFRAVSDYYMKNMQESRMEILKKDRKLKVYRDSLSSYKKQLAQLKITSSEPSGVINMVIVSKTAKKTSLSLSYIVKKASWTPSYDIRFESLDKPLKLAYKANMKQTTGIDWEKIKLSLSTAQTQVSADIPILSPYYLQFYEITQKPRQISLQASAYNTVQWAGDKSEGAFEISKKKEETPNQKYQQGTSFTFDVEGTQSLKSENKQNMIRYKDTDVPCTYVYKTIPKLSDNVFLIGRIANWYDMGILSGDLNLYFENAFVGTSYINTEQFSDTLDISFGVDQGISVKREKIKEFTSSKIFGSNKKESVAWRITIKNNKNDKVKVKVFDQVPLSKNADFEVKIENLSGAKLNDSNGEIEWNIELAPKETKQMILQYSVKYPKGMNLLTD
jgi:uncharacterized protein (TIGR02231 family)